MEKKAGIGSNILNFYLDGFRGMSKSSKQLWLIILIKLFIMFAVMKLFFFPNLLKSDFKSDEERSQHVIEQLTEPRK